MLLRSYVQLVSHLLLSSNQSLLDNDQTSHLYYLPILCSFGCLCDTVSLWACLSICRQPIVFQPLTSTACRRRRRRQLKWFHSFLAFIQSLNYLNRVQELQAKLEVWSQPRYFLHHRDDYLCRVQPKADKLVNIDRLVWNSLLTVLSGSSSRMSRLELTPQDPSTRVARFSVVIAIQGRTQKFKAYGTAGPRRTKAFCPAKGCSKSLTERDADKLKIHLTREHKVKVESVTPINQKK